MKDARHELVERFYRYVSVPSQSRDNGGVQVPSTEGQWDMAELLKAECEALGLVDLEISKACVLTGKLPARLPEGFAGSVPSVGFCTHMDTVDVCLSPEIHPQMIANYDGGDIVLNEEQQIVMAAAEHLELRKFVGQDIIVTDGTSVLGSDNKAAIANVMTALSTLAGDDSLYHGDIYVAFVPDEECGLFGSKNMDFSKFPVDFAYTIDSCDVGEVVYETFNAGSAEVVIHGVSAHPMSAKGVLINPTLLAVDFINMFDRRETPESDGRHRRYRHSVLSARRAWRRRGPSVQRRRRDTSGGFRAVPADRRCLYDLLCGFPGEFPRGGGGGRLATADRPDVYGPLPAVAGWNGVRRAESEDGLCRRRSSGGRGGLRSPAGRIRQAAVLPGRDPCAALQW